MTAILSIKKAASSPLGLGSWLTRARDPIPKPESISRIRFSKAANHMVSPFFAFEHLFGFVSDFGFRISDFRRAFSLKLSWNQKMRSPWC
jgi:hypothetical protein